MRDKEALKVIKENLAVAIQDFDDPTDENQREQAEGLQKAKEALEKQIPKKPTIDEQGFFHCPSCGGDDYCLMHDNIYDDRYKYCHECGQRLDWENEND